MYLHSVPNSDNPSSLSPGIANQNSASINIKNLRLRTLIGFNPEERTKPQDIVINIEIDYQVTPAVLDDEVAEALNYKTITKEVINYVENGSFLLLERLVSDVLNICSASSSVERASVTIDKPHALRFADSVSLTMAYKKESN